MPLIRHPEPIEADAAERKAIAAFLARFLEDRGAHVPQLTAPDQAPLELPHALYEIFKRSAEILARGEMVSIVPVNRLLTTQEAANLLNVSREYVRRLIRDRHIPSVDVGRHHRIRFADVIEFRDRRDAQRREALANITRMGVEAGGYFDD